MRFPYASLLAFGVLSSVSAQPKIQLRLFASGFNRPVDIAHCGDSRLFVVEQRGLIWVLDSAGNRLDTFLNISARVRATGNEQGLLGLAFAPDYRQLGYFYVNYTRQPDGATVISRFSVLPTQPNRADVNSELVLLTQPQPYNNHNGGCLKFGPDGYLYIGLGDGGSGGDPQNFAQNPASLLGKTLRIDVRSAAGGQPYSIPADNPFVQNPAFRPEIWSLGWRNHWRFSFDRLTGDFWAGDVGQNAREEIDFEPAGVGGRNYGWRCYEGTLPYNTSGCLPASAYVPPIFEYANPTVGRSVTGGFVYRGSRHPELYGYYFFADYVSGRWWVTRQARPDSFETTTLGVLTPAQISTFGEDRDGELYVAALSQGTVYRVEGQCSGFRVSIQAVALPTCWNTSDGAIAVQVTGGQSPLTFVWADTTAVDSVRATLPPGAYVVEVRDAVGCLQRDTLLLQPLETPPSDLQLVYSNGILRVSSGPWTTYQWKRDGVPITGATDSTLVPAENGYYSCQVASPRGCLYEPGIEVTDITATTQPDDVDILLLYPNPARAGARLFVRLKQPAAITWSLADASGRMLHFQQREAAVAFEERLPIEGLVPGLYYVRLSTLGGTAVVPLSVVR